MRFAEVLRWPLREGLVAYAETLRDVALEEYRVALLVAAARGAKAPKPPKILRD